MQTITENTNEVETVAVEAACACASLVGGVDSSA